MRKTIQNFIASVGLGLSSLLYPTNIEAQPTRVSWTETFDGTISRHYIAEPADEWTIGSQYLEASDFYDNELNFIFTDRKYNNKENLSLEVTFNKTEWDSDVEQVGLVFGNCEFVINASNEIQQYWINKISPDVNHTYVNGATSINDDNAQNIIPNGTNTLKVSYDAQSWHFFINGNELDSKTINNLNSRLPNITGNIGIRIRNSNASNSLSKTYFDNFAVEYDVIYFIRGDVNRDRKVDISDPITTLSYLFNENLELKCLDAADSNDDGSSDISDAVYTLDFLFTGVPIIPQPYPKEGEDPTLDELVCKEY